MTKKESKKKSNTKVAVKKNEGAEVKEISPKKYLLEDFSVYIPLATISEANTFEHWSDRHRRHKKQKAIVKLTVPTQAYPMPCTIQLTRISPRNLDDDNLVSAFKHIRDAIAEKINPGLAPGRADDDQRITWEYSQEKGPPKQQGIRVSFLWS